jgi:biopolymer transport protein ExbB
MNLSMQFDIRRAIVVFCLASSAFVFASPFTQTGFGQEGTTTQPPLVVAGPEPAVTTNSADGMNFLKLVVLGGWFMIPLGAVSFAVVALAVERGIAIRRERLLPQRFVERLGRLGDQPGGLDPRDAYRICQSLPSVASDVLRRVLVKVGRPHSELEAALNDSAQRSAIRLQQPVSWLTWCAAIAPLLGLLGTVWGITQAFYDTTQLEVGQNRAEALASGIYMALVTTIFGLLIAIPATTFAHFYENRIITLMGEIEELYSSLLPQLERYEGQVRFTLAEAQENGRSTTGDGTKPPRTNPDGLPIPEKRTRAST